MTIFAYACIAPHNTTEDVPSIFPPKIDRLYLDHCYPQELHRELQTLLSDCGVKPPDRLLVPLLGDLGGTAQEAIATLQQLESYKISVTVLDGSYQTGTPALEYWPPQAIIPLAEKVHAQHRTATLVAGHARNRLSALPPPGRAPYGYRRGRYHYALDRATAPGVKSFFEHYILYGSVRGAARYIEKNHGKRVSASTALRWLRHPAYRGDSQYSDGNIIRNTHTPIISREEAAQVDRLLRRNQQLPPKTASAERSLAGLVRCALCQSPFKVSKVKSSRRPKEYLYLRPVHCKRSPACSAMDYDTVLQVTIEHICIHLPQAAQKFQATPVIERKVHLSAQVEDKKRLLKEIEILKIQGILDDRSAQLRTYSLKGELSRLEQQLSQLPPENLPQISQTLGSRSFWHDLSEAERRVYFREFVKVIEVNPVEALYVRVSFVF